MSTQEIGALIDSVNEMTQTVANKNAEIDAKIDEATQEIEDKFLDLSKKTYFVDGLLGSDSNDGLSSAKPLQTLGKAYELCLTDSASLNKISIIRDGEYGLPADVTASVLTNKIIIEATGLSNKTYPDDLGVTVKVLGNYISCNTNHEILYCNIKVESTTYGFLCGDGIKVRTYKCKVIKASSVNHFLANYHDPAGLNYATFQLTTFDGAGADFFPVGKLQGTTFWKQLDVTLQNGAKMNPSYTKLADLQVY